MRLAVLAAAGMLLSGCATHMKPDDAVQLIKAFGDAGCKGRIHADLGAGTGQMGGEAHINANADGECDPADRPARKPSTLDEPLLGTVVGGPGG